MMMINRLRFILAGLAIALGMSLVAPSAHAADAVIDAAKIAGDVGERPDGYLGLVDGSVEPAVRRRVDEINARRRALYERLARERGATVEQVGFLTGEKQIANTPSGQYYMTTSGSWVQK
ncbi:MAG: YdbL family protein [Pseudomonadota bacterium]